MRRKTRAAVTCILLMAGLCSVPSDLAAAAPANEAPASHGMVLGIEGSAFTYMSSCDRKTCNSTP